MFYIIMSIFLVGDVGWWIWADAKLRRARARKTWRVLLGIFTALFAGYLVFFLSMPHYGMLAHHGLPPIALATIYVWHVFVLPITALAILAYESGRGLAWFARSVSRKEANSSAAVRDEPKLSRRDALALSLVTAPPILLGGTVGYCLKSLGSFRIRKMDIPLVDLPMDLDGMTIAHVSDVHVGRFTRGAMLPKIVDATNALKADFIAFTGDLIDLSITDLTASIDMMKRFDPRHGLFMVEGNHDLIEDADEFETRCKRESLPLLLNETMLTQHNGRPVQFMGMVWHRRDQQMAASMADLQSQRVHGAFPILLAHHPHVFDVAASAGIPLTLAGHTHGGQLMLNERLGAGSIMFRYWSGLYQKNDSALVVSNGVGNWFPLRVQAPAEIVHLTLRRA
ncbi:MAG TPA: metallophosphoesterase [Tepidisphaeraceae bacterium]|jgi:hypothetical protein